MTVKNSPDTSKFSIDEKVSVLCHVGSEANNSFLITDLSKRESLYCLCDVSERCRIKLNVCYWIFSVVGQLL